MTVPRFAFAYAELALVAADLRDTRAKGDPQHVRDGKLTVADATDRLRIATAIALDWAHYAERRMPPAGATTEAEKLATIERACAIWTTRADHARKAIVAEHGERFFVRTHDQLWALVDAHDSTTARVLPYLRAESYAAALEAMAWWMRLDRDGLHGIRAMTSINAARPDRAASAGAKAA